MNITYKTLFDTVKAKISAAYSSKFATKFEQLYNTYMLLYGLPNASTNTASVSLNNFIVYLANISNIIYKLKNTLTVESITPFSTTTTISETCTPKLTVSAELVNTNNGVNFLDTLLINSAGLDALLKNLIAEKNNSLPIKATYTFTAFCSSSSCSTSCSTSCSCCSSSHFIGFMKIF